MIGAAEWDGDLEGLIHDYRYQPELTRRLDSLGPDAFTQTIINEIVLWKVNRYANLSRAAIAALNTVANVPPRSHRRGHRELATLLSEPGVDLPMASTFFRFRNARTFQIIDRHAYRAVYGETYPLYSSSSDTAKIELYFSYLDALLDLADSRGIAFDVLDRVLYIFDKRINGRL